MKKISIICVLLATLMVLPFMLGSCNNKIYSTVSIKFQEPETDAEGKPILDDEGNPKYVELFALPEVKVEGTTDDKPTALKAATMALDKYEKDYTLTEDGGSIASVFGHQEQDSADEKTGYFQFWEVTINGKRSDAGRQSVTEIYDGDEIVYTWTMDSEPRQDTGVVETTNPNDETTYHSEETTEAEEEEEIA